jgi:hypothetical protein
MSFYLLRGDTVYLFVVGSTLNRSLARKQERRLQLVVMSCNLSWTMRFGRCGMIGEIKGIAKHEGLLLLLVMLYGDSHR